MYFNDLLKHISIKYGAWVYNVCLEKRNSANHCSCPNVVVIMKFIRHQFLYLLIGNILNSPRRYGIRILLDRMEKWGIKIL